MRKQQAYTEIVFSQGELLKVIPEAMSMWLMANEGIDIPAQELKFKVINCDDEYIYHNGYIEEGPKADYEYDRYYVNEISKTATADALFIRGMTDTEREQVAKAAKAKAAKAAKSKTNTAAKPKAKAK